MILKEEIEDLKSFFERAFPDLKEYKNEKSIDPKIETIIFTWEKEDYAFHILNKLKIISYGHKTGLIDNILKKQLEIDILRKESMVIEIVRN